jgi:hypothetical protein
MMNWKGFGRKQSWSFFKAVSRHSSGGTEEMHENAVRIVGLLAEI